MPNQTNEGSWIDHPLFEWYRWLVIRAVRIVLLIVFSPIILIVVLTFAAIMPYAMARSFLHNRRADRRLRSDKREIHWTDALKLHRSGNHQLLAEITKNDRAIFWLVPETSHEFSGFSALPTLKDYEADGRQTVMALLSLDAQVTKSFTPGFERALKVIDAPDDFKQLPESLKESILFMLLIGPGPSQLLHKLVA